MHCATLYVCAFNRAIGKNWNHKRKHKHDKVKHVNYALCWLCGIKLELFFFCFWLDERKSTVGVVSNADQCFGWPQKRANNQKPAAYIIVHVVVARLS